MTAELKGARRSIRSHLIAGLALMLVLAGGFGGWASTVQISGALIAPGAIVVDSNVKKVQHPTGGVVGEVRARDGTVVKAGDIVVRLDDTVTKASLAIVTKSLNGLWARAARLEAEQQGLDKLTFPPMLLDRADDPDVKNVMASEGKLFVVRHLRLMRVTCSCGYLLLWRRRWHAIRSEPSVELFLRDTVK